MAALSPAFKTAVTSYGVKIVFGVTINGLRPAIHGSVSTTVQLLAGSEPFYRADSGGWFRTPFIGSVRFKRSAPHVLAANGGAEVVNSYGELAVGNHNKELDSDWGAQGYQTTNQSVIVTAQAIPGKHTHLGPETATIFSGQAEAHTLTDTEMRVPVTNLLNLLDTQLVTEKINVIDFPHAPEASLGAVKPLILGTCYNVEGLSVDPLNQGGKFLFAYHGCATGTFYRNGLAMVAGTDYIVDLTGDNGGTFITLLNARQGARITGDLEGITPPHLGVFSDKLTEVNLAVLSLAGFAVASFDAAALTSLRATYDYRVGLCVKETQSARDIFRALNAGIPLFFEQYRDGEYVLAPWTNPSGTPEVTFVRDTDVIDADFTAAPLIREVQLTYAPYETTMTAGDLAGVLLDDDPNRVDRLATATRSHTATVATADLQLPVFSADTRLVDVADVTDLGTKLLALYGQPHIQITAIIPSSGIGVRGIGSVISFSRTRLGLDQGDLLARVADMEEVWDASGATVTFILWRKVVG